MNESEQDALLDRIESRRRWRIIRSRAIVAIGGVLALAVVAIATVLIGTR